MSYRLGVDVGGTFTDLMLVRNEDGASNRVKTPSTPADPSQGVLVGVKRILEESGASPQEVTSIMHGTTVATNAVLEGKGARVGLITTEGFGQILHLARSQTPGPLAGWMIMIKPDPPAALEDTREAHERMSAKGEVVKPVDPEQIKKIVTDLVESGTESLTVSLINSFANDAHEREIGRIIHELYPGFPVTLSSDVLPEFREYERTVTACMNSYVRPKVGGYLRNLSASLAEQGVAGSLNILRSDAGLMTSEVTQEKPVYAILSGPAGGVAGALEVAKRAGYPDILVFDMGGTSTDVALCQNGQPGLARETELGHFRVKVPSVNVHSVGAGGGSIAHVPEITKALRVGPESAGADPGPACYGKGGTAPAVSDANVVVGHLPPSLLGGEMVLDVEAAKTAVSTIGDALGLDVYQAAAGIFDIVNENMAGALRLVSVQRGYDPRDFALVAFGGAGPMHANAVAALMGSYPGHRAAGAGRALRRGRSGGRFPRGVLAHLHPHRRVGRDRRGRRHPQGTRQGGHRVARAGGHQRGSPRVDLQRRSSLLRQGYEIPVEVNLAELTEGEQRAPRPEVQRAPRTVLRLPHGRHRVRDRQSPGGGRRQGARSTGPRGGRSRIGRCLGRGGRPNTRSTARASGSRPRSTTAASSGPGTGFPGPAIITEFDSTTVVLPGYTAEIDRFANILINPNSREE